MGWVIKMSKIYVINAATGEEVLREMTSDELAELQIAKLEFETITKIQADAKAILLAKLGITEDEAKLLLS